MPLSTWKPCGGASERPRRVPMPRPRPVFITAGAAAILAAVAVPFLGGRFLPEFQEQTVIAHVNALPGTSLAEAVRLAGRIDAQLRPEAVAHVEAHVGRAELGEDVVPVSAIEFD